MTKFHTVIFQFFKRDDISKCKINPYNAFVNTLDDGTSWAEGALCHPSLSHICVCLAIQDIIDHCNFSIPDLLHLNSFTTKVWLEVKQDFTQSSIRSFEKEFRSWKSDTDIDNVCKEGHTKCR